MSKFRWALFRNKSYSFSNRSIVWKRTVVFRITSPHTWKYWIWYTIPLVFMQQNQTAKQIHRCSTVVTRSSYSHNRLYSRKYNRDKGSTFSVFSFFFKWNPFPVVVYRNVCTSQRGERGGTRELTPTCFLSKIPEERYVGTSWVTRVYARTN